MQSSELIAALEAADGPSRELDAAIGVVIGRFFTKPSRFGFDSLDYCYIDKDGSEVSPGHGGDQCVPAYTGSIDKALTLVSQEAFWSLTCDGDGEGYHAACEAVDYPVMDLRWVKASTPAIALCIAALKAGASHD